MKKLPRKTILLLHHPPPCANLLRARVERGGAVSVASGGIEDALPAGGGAGECP